MRTHALLGALATSGWTPAQASVVTDWNAITLICVQGQWHRSPYLQTGRVHPGCWTSRWSMPRARRGAGQPGPLPFEAHHSRIAAVTRSGLSRGGRRGRGLMACLSRPVQAPPTRCLRPTVTNPAGHLRRRSRLAGGKRGCRRVAAAAAPDRRPGRPLHRWHQPRRMASDDRGAPAPPALPVPHGDAASFVLNRNFAVPPAAPAAALRASPYARDPTKSRRLGS